MPSINGILVWCVQIFLWVVTAVVIGAILYQLNKLRGAGRVASRPFERRYRIVRKFLADVSTDRLDDVPAGAAAAGGSPAQRQQSWQALDQELSEAFMVAWATADEAEAAIDPRSYMPPPCAPGSRRGPCARLLLTERPRDFGRYSLPYLTCLYRICAAQELKDWRVPEEMASADSAVGAEELHRVLTGAQYDWFTRQEADLLRPGFGRPSSRP